MTPSALLDSGLNTDQEWVSYYTEDEPFLAVPVDRKVFENEEISRKGPPTRFVEVVHGLLVRSIGERIHLVLQYRNPDKKFNGGLLDKTFGGHCPVGQDRKTALEMEARQELGMSLKICDNHHDALTYFMALKGNLNKSGIGYIDSTFNLLSHRILKDGREVIIGNRVHFAPFLYHGPTELPDGEASGTQSISLDQILQDISNGDQNRYTNDLCFLVTHFQDQIRNMARMLISGDLILLDGKAENPKA